MASVPPLVEVSNEEVCDGRIIIDDEKLKGIAGDHLHTLYIFYNHKSTILATPPSFFFSLAKLRFSPREAVNLATLNRIASRNSYKPSFFSIAWPRSMSSRSRCTQAVCCFAAASGTIGVDHQVPPEMLFVTPAWAPTMVPSPISM